MDKQKILNSIKDGYRFLEMLEQKFPKAKNHVNNIGWILGAIREEISKPDTPVAPAIPVKTEETK